MRLETEDAEPLHESVWVVITPYEAEMLARALANYFEEPEPRQKGWHHHLQGEPGQLTVAIEEPERE
jgi:hypothetical protein